MRRGIILSLFFVIICAVPSHAGFFESIFKILGGPASQDADNSTIISGLKEALSIGTRNAVEDVSQANGYFGNETIRILMPERIQMVADVLGKVGYQEEVDEFILSMNRAAEKAAPQAASFFIDAIKDMSFADAQEILNGGDTAATDFFKDRTSEKLYAAFKPVISSSMDKVGTVHAYKEMMGQYQSLPFVGKESLDLDHYVTNKALDGLFYMVGQEEKKIRNDPAARVTEVLEKVFGG
jgi:hypothetical protein